MAEPSCAVEDTNPASENGYHGTECRLSDSEHAELSLHLEQKLYQTIAAIRDYIEANYKVRYSQSGLGHFLKRLGFVYKKPKAIPGKADKAELKSLMTPNFHTIGA